MVSGLSTAPQATAVTDGPQEEATAATRFVDTRPWPVSVNVQGFAMEQFHELDKQQIAIDLLAALQAQHRRFKVSANTAQTSGSVQITSADGGAYGLVRGTVSAD